MVLRNPPGRQPWDLPPGIPEGSVKIDFVPQRTPPSFDDIYESYKSNKLIGTEGVLSLVKDEGLFLSQHVEQFNFGSLTEDAIMDACEEASEFVREGLLQLPYNMCLYRCTIEYPQEEEGRRFAGVSLLLVTKQHDVLNGAFKCVDFAKSQSGHLMAVLSQNNMKVCTAPDGTQGMEIALHSEEQNFWSERIRSNKGEPPTPRMLADGSMLAVGLTMILNTKGIRKERTEPPRKPNQMREKAGRPLLPWVTKVYTNVYNQAIAPGTGTHASPRPHRRRAHIRTYPARGDRPGYSIPIPAMLVNWDGKPLERGQYDVEVPKS